MSQRFSRPGAALASATLGLASLFLLVGADVGHARPAKARPAKQQAVEQPKAKEPAERFAGMKGDQADASTTTGSVDKDTDAAGCLRSRKKLFVEGEGWIVRRVTTCR
jgi:hypothetical protein